MPRYGPFEYERRLGQRNYDMSAQVDEIIAKTEKRLNALLRESVQRVVDEAQKPVAKGGHMRVDTGFLRASGQSSFDGLPTGPQIGESKIKHFYDDGAKNQAILNLGKLEIGKAFYFGWTANYAKYREAYDGFLEGAVQKWPQIVATVTAEIKARIP